MLDLRQSPTHLLTVQRADNAVKGNTDVSITASEPPATGAAQTVDIGKRAIVPAAVFVIVEIMLVAETILVILFKELDPRNPGTAPITILRRKLALPTMPTSG